MSSMGIKDEKSKKKNNKYNSEFLHGMLLIDCINCKSIEIVLLEIWMVLLICFETY